MLEEFDDPDYPFDPVYNHARYVQAECDQAFRVQIKLCAGFDFCGADVVRCRLFLDDDGAPFWSTFTDPPADGIVKQDRTQYIATATRRNEATGRWEKMPFVFGGLKVVEDEEEAAAYVPKISPEQARELGSIRLTCFRAYVQEQDLRQPLRHLEHNPPVRKPVVSEVLKKDLVIHREGDKFLSNTVKFGRGKTAYMKPPNQNKQRYIHPRIRGNAGNNIEFEFKYRNRELLRSLGIVAAASPAPSVNRNPPPLGFFTPEPDIRSQTTSKRTGDTDETDGNGDLVMKSIEWKRARTGELLEVIDLTND